MSLFEKLNFSENANSQNSLIAIENEEKSRDRQSYLKKKSSSL